MIIDLSTCSSRQGLLAHSSLASCLHLVSGVVLFTETLSVVHTCLGHVSHLTLGSLTKYEGF